MIKKDLADHVFYNVTPTDKTFEAIAIYDGKVIATGTIPYIFSNYRGFVDYNAQGKYILQTKHSSFDIGESATGIVISETEVYNEEHIIWHIVNNNCIPKNTDLLDPHWDDH